VILLAASLAAASQAEGQQQKVQLSQQDLQSLVRRAGGGDILAMAALGDVYLSGDKGAPPNQAEGLRWLSLAIEKGHADAADYLAQVYEKGGHGVESDLGKARGLHARAAELGAVFGLINLGRLAEQDLEPDYAGAVRYYRQAAEQQSAEALFRLGRLYLAGNGVPADRLEADRLLRMAAAMGHEQAAEWTADPGASIRQGTAEEQKTAKVTAEQIIADSKTGRAFENASRGMLPLARHVESGLTCQFSTTSPDAEKIALEPNGGASCRKPGVLLQADRAAQGATAQAELARFAALVQATDRELKPAESPIPGGRAHRDCISRDLADRWRPLHAPVGRRG
jgi:TPR repeat protein